MDGLAAGLPATWHHVRPTLERGNSEPPAWLGGLGGRGPVVYATLGTVHSGPDLLAAIVDALAAEPLELVVTTGPVDPAALGPQPEHVHLARWIAQADLLECCDAVVTHGGFGTMAASLTHGVPLVMLPISADQPMNARRAVEAGVGIGLAATDRTVGDIRAAVDAVLTDPRYAAAASAAAAQAAAQPPLDHGLDLLEALIARPVLSCVRC
jgi:MGT family glycosyltransferase